MVGDAVVPGCAIVAVGDAGRVGRPALELHEPRKTKDKATHTLA
jgi:hypothetical protein